MSDDEYRDKLLANARKYEPGSPKEVIDVRLPLEIPRDIWLDKNWLVYERQGPSGPWHHIILLVTNRALTPGEKLALQHWSYYNVSAVYKVDWEFAVYDRG